MAKTRDTAVVPTHFPFLRLPREIRDMIDDHTFDLPRPSARAMMGPDGKSIPRILLVSRCIYAEAREVLY